DRGTCSQQNPTRRHLPREPRQETPCGKIGERQTSEIPPASSSSNRSPRDYLRIGMLLCDGLPMPIRQQESPLASYKIEIPALHMTKLLRFFRRSHQHTAFSATLLLITAVMLSRVI